MSQLKQLNSCLVVQSLGPLVNPRRQFQMLMENSSILLQLDVAVGHFTKQVGSLLGWISCLIPEVLCLFSNGIDYLLGFLLPHDSRSWGHLLPLSNLSLAILHG